MKFIKWRKIFTKHIYLQKDLYPDNKNALKNQN